jgi:hypothetical protein
VYKIKHSYLKLATFETVSGVNAFLNCGPEVQFTLYKFRETGVGGILASISAKYSKASGFDACICNKNKGHVSFQNFSPLVWLQFKVLTPQL